MLETQEDRRAAWAEIREFLVRAGVLAALLAVPDIYEQTPRYENGVQYPLTLADGEYFILCDARAGARDSRWFGPVRTGEIRGRVIALLRRSGI